jgi:beta-phosphoglucomutase-like phosphatase (HAD superfamily)
VCSADVTTSPFGINGYLLLSQIPTSWLYKSQRRWAGVYSEVAPPGTGLYYRADLALSPADADRGRPWPDLPLTALIRLGGGSVSELAVVGDTPSDIESGRRAGAAVVAGVLTGAATRADLEQAGAPLILGMVADLLPHLSC